MTYIPLHLHSCYSPKWGVHSLDEICKAAVRLEFKTLALTDCNGIYGIPNFPDCARHHGLNPIIGSELVYADQRAFVLVRNHTGYANLCRLLSDLHCSEDFRNGLTIISDQHELLTGLRAQNKEHLYVELSPVGVKIVVTSVSSRGFGTKVLF
jgi:DNA polymerase III alpha subunit